MTRAVGNGMIQTLANAIGTGAVGKLAKQVAGLSTDMANIKTPDKGSGLMFNPDTGKLYIPCGNGITVNKNTGMLEVPIGEHLRYTGSGLDVPDADETTAGVVKLTHEVRNRDDGEWAITADGVYAYTLGYASPGSRVTVEMKITGVSVFAMAVPGLIYIQFVQQSDTPVPIGDPIFHIPGYAADVEQILWDGIYYTPVNENGGITVKSLNELPEGDLGLIIPAHKI